MLFSAHHIRRQRMSDHPIIDGVNLDHLHKFVSARLCHQVSISLFVINEYFVENTETMPVSTVHQNCTHTQTTPGFINHHCVVCQMMTFLFFTLHFLVGILLLELILPHSHSFIDQHRFIKSYFSSCFIIHYYIIYLINK